jgi:hypothetical protein
VRLLPGAATSLQLPWLREPLYQQAQHFLGQLGLAPYLLSRSSALALQP